MRNRAETQYSKGFGKPLTGSGKGFWQPRKPKKTLKMGGPARKFGPFVQHLGANAYL
jgi:hypothetical protein